MAIAATKISEQSERCVDIFEKRSKTMENEVIKFNNNITNSLNTANQIVCDTKDYTVEEIKNMKNKLNKYESLLKNEYNNRLTNFNEEYSKIKNYGFLGYCVSIFTFIQLNAMSFTVIIASMSICYHFNPGLYNSFTYTISTISYLICNIFYIIYSIFYYTLNFIFMVTYWVLYLFVLVLFVYLIMKAINKVNQDYSNDYKIMNDKIINILQNNINLERDIKKISLELNSLKNKNILKINIDNDLMIENKKEN